MIAPLRQSRSRAAKVSAFVAELAVMTAHPLLYNAPRRSTPMALSINQRAEQRSCASVVQCDLDQRMKDPQFAPHHGPVPASVLVHLDGTPRALAFQQYPLHN